jgi:hypothetical protein
VDQTGRHIFYGNWPGLGGHLPRLSMNQNSRKQSEAYRGRSDPSHPATPASRRRDAKGNAVAGWPTNDPVGRWFRRTYVQVRQADRRGARHAAEY